WVKIRPPYWASLRWPPVESSEAALGEALLAGPLRIQGSWLLGVLIAGGLIAALRRRRRWLAWSAGAWAICCLLWSAAAAWPQDGLRFWFVGGYYSDPYRLAALLAIPSLPLAAVGLEYALRWLNAGLRRRGLGQPVWAAAALAVAVAAALTAGTQATAGMNAAIDVVSDDYQINADSPLVDSDEYRLIERLPELVPAGVRVAVNPWNGSSMAYALVGVLTTTTHVAYEASPAEAVIDNRLSQVGSDPAGVCPAVRERGVGYALDFGSKEVHGGENPLPGLENLATAPGFEEVAREGHAVLYKVTACS
ncbi:MAG: hypothetical protein LBI84_05630, partial [Propionibacteriaceae bacterium]|nr:hypothetical protein [Propionibacteriaceae bacterium]